jgi:hypothetical protein
MSSIIAPFGFSPHGGGPCTVLYRFCLSIPPLRPCPQRRGTFHAWNAQVPNLLENRYISVLRPLPRCVIWSVLLLVIQYKTRFTSRPCHPSFRTSRSCRPVLRGSAQIRSGWTTRSQRPSRSSTEHARSPLWLVGYTVIGFVE